MAGIVFQHGKDEDTRVRFQAIDSEYGHAEAGEFSGMPLFHCLYRFNPKFPDAATRLIALGRLSQLA
ncbi:MAG TPA: hypothetical protein EYQ50_19430 [Verrucomicrobiales bacterium]|nr:hypothetical protein [Verrucomicrobiales bacterium]HIL69880.1 hypothetical protein [Verrucomicrobiota bacterium]